MKLACQVRAFRHDVVGLVRVLLDPVQLFPVAIHEPQIVPLRGSDEIVLREGAGLKEIGQHAAARAERATIIRVLKETRGNKRKAAKVLQIDYTTLFEKLKRYEIDYKNL